MLGVFLTYRGGGSILGAVLPCGGLHVRRMSSPWGRTEIFDFEVGCLGNVTINLKNITNDTANDTDSQNITQTKKTTTKKTTSSNTKASSSSKSKYADDEVYDVVIPGTGGKTTKARRTGLTEYGNRYEEVGTGKAIYV